MERKPEDIAKMNLYQKINALRVDFLNSGIQKSGKNGHLEYKFYTLDDIVPVLLPLNEKYGLTTVTSFANGVASLTVIDTDAEDFNHVVFEADLVELIQKGMNAPQAAGSVQTYYRRYLYIMYLDIVEQELLDEQQGKPEEDDKKKKGTKKETSKPKVHSTKPATTKERQEAKKEVINKDGAADKVTVESIKKGLTQYRAHGGDEVWIAEIANKMRNKPTNEEASQILVEVSERVQKAING